MSKFPFNHTINPMAQAAQKKSLQSRISESLTAQLQSGVQDGVFPGVAALVLQKSRPIFEGAFGVRSHKEPYSGPVHIETVFDVAALTSVLAITAICMKLCESGKISLSDRVSRYIPSFGVLGKSTITIRHLLAHTSGLPAWHPFFEELLQQQAKMSRSLVTSRSAREYTFNAINRLQIKTEVGARRVYSDLGLILLGNIIETTTGLALDRVFQKYIAKAVPLVRTSFIDLDLLKRRGLEPVIDQIAPTEDCPWRKRILCGEVHDDNAWMMGGVAGHSGLFSTVRDIARFGQELIDASKGKGVLFSQNIIEQFFAAEVLGFESPSVENGLAQVGFSENTIGLNSFTGCSLWIDFDNEVVTALCSNRIHPSEANRKIASFRPEFFKALTESLRA